jgi:hypothetical protein
MAGCLLHLQLLFLTPGKPSGATCVDAAPPDTPLILPKAPLNFSPFRSAADPADSKDDDEDRQHTRTPPPLRLAWLHDGAPLLQGWGSPYQTILVERAAGPNASTFVQALRSEFGFSAVILCPPGTSGWGGSHPATFARAVKAYAGAGMGVVLYSSIVHAGEDPAWTSGNLSRDHPSWLQRRADGSPWLLETKPALTPASDGAVWWTLNRTLGLLRDFPQASAVMLDNSELCPDAAKGMCDYSSAALAKWRAYLTARFPAEWAQRCLHISDRATAPLPTAAQKGSPVFGVFCQFRNRINAAGLEFFRSALRALPGRDGGVALFANTELEWPNGALATRLQPSHEDAILTESYDTGASAVDKAQLSSAMAPLEDFPVYNFLGSFNKTDYHRLIAPPLALSQLAATLMARAKPWLVYYGLHTPSPSRTIISNLLRFRFAHPGLYERRSQQRRRGRQGGDRSGSGGLTALAPLVAVLSPLSTELQGERQVGSWFEAARRLGVPVRLVSSQRLCGELSGRSTVRVLLMQSVCVMPRADADCVNRWVERGGGTLIQRDGISAMFDELGQPRPTSAVAPGARVLNNAAEGFTPESADVVKALAWIEESAQGTAQWQLTPYRTANDSTLVLHGLLLQSSGGSPACPAAMPFIYGSHTAGYYCCSVPATSSCAGELCCEQPGTTSGCQGNARCHKDQQLTHTRTPPSANTTALSMRLPLVKLLNSTGDPKTASVKLWAPATSMSDYVAASSAGLRSWMKDGALVVKMLKAPRYFVLTASLGDDARRPRFEAARAHGLQHV